MPVSPFGEGRCIVLSPTSREYAFGGLMASVDAHWKMVTSEAQMSQDFPSRECSTATLHGMSSDGHR